MSALAPLLVGLAFGALLQLGGLTRYERIAGVYRLRDLAVLKFLVTAIVTGAIVVHAARSLGFVDAVPIPPTHFAANLVGGAIFGIGMSTAGFCSGTIVAGAGGGQIDALLAGIPGLLAGSLAYDAIVDRLPPSLARADVAGPATLPAALGVSEWLLLALLVEVALLGSYALERGVRLENGGRT